MKNALTFWHSPSVPFPQALLTAASRLALALALASGLPLRAAQELDLEEVTFDTLRKPEAKATYEAALARIPEIRRGEFILQFVNEQGQPIQEEVTLELVRHHFNFGIAYGPLVEPWSRFNHPVYTEEVEQKALDLSVELFSYGSFNAHWSHVTNADFHNPENWDWSTPNTILELASEHDLKLRQHCIFYPNPGLMPSGVVELQSTEAWWEQMEIWLQELASHLSSDQVDTFDVINEMFFKRQWADEEVPLMPRFRNPEVGIRAFKLADKYLPDAKLIVLNHFYPLLDSANNGFFEYYDYVKALIEGGAPIDGIGFQAHFHLQKDTLPEETMNYVGTGAFDLDEIEKGMDNIAALGLPIYITEYSTIDFRYGKQANQQGHTLFVNQQTKDDFTAKFYALAFSKPYVKEITRWYAVDLIGGTAKDGFLTTDGKIKPTYYLLKDLFFDRWATRYTGASPQGTHKLPAFYGTYQVSAKGYAAETMQLTPDGSSELVFTLKKSSN